MAKANGLASPTNPVARTHPHRNKCEAPEGAGLSPGETVALFCHEHGSFGLDIQMPLKVVVTGLRPGGPPEMVIFSFELLYCDLLSLCRD